MIIITMAECPTFHSTGTLEVAYLIQLSIIVIDYTYTFHFMPVCHCYCCEHNLLKVYGTKK